MLNVAKECCFPPKVSVIVPVYNAQETLDRCLNSILSQTLSGIEIIVVNDGSTDGSKDIIREYENRFPSIVKVYNKSNKGMSDTRNCGIRLAEGDYISFIDSDDYIAPDFLLEMYQRAETEDAQVVCCGYDEIFPSKTITHVCDDISIFNQCVSKSPRILEYAQPFAWNKIYRRDLWQSELMSFPIGQWYEDSAIIYNVLLLSNKVSIVNEALYYYTRTNPGAITRQANEHVFDIFLSMQNMTEFYRSHDQYDKLYEEIELINVKHITARYNALLHCKDKKLARQFTREAFEFLDINFPTWRECRYMHPRGRVDRLKKVIQSYKILALIAVSI